MGDITSLRSSDRESLATGRPSGGGGFIYCADDSGLVPTSGEENNVNIGSTVEFVLTSQAKVNLQFSWQFEIAATFSGDTDLYGFVDGNTVFERQGPGIRTFMTTTVVTLGAGLHVITSSGTWHLVDIAAYAQSQIVAVVGAA